MANTFTYSAAGEIKALSSILAIENITEKLYVACATAGGVANPAVTNAGSGYTSLPTVSFTGGGGTGAAATAVVALGGTLIGLTITNPGSGYTSAPTVAFAGGSGTGAAATVTGGGIPSTASVVGDFTEATFTGYSAKTLTGTLTGTTWATPTGTPATSQYNSASPQSWTATGAYQTILGYYHVGATTGTFYGAQSFASSVVMSSGQPSMTMVPSLSQGTLPVATS